LYPGVYIDKGFCLYQNDTNFDTLNIPVISIQIVFSMLILYAFETDSVTLIDTDSCGTWPEGKMGHYLAPAGIIPFAPI
jgi:hypothetical protein